MHGRQNIKKKKKKNPNPSLQEVRNNINIPQNLEKIRMPYGSRRMIIDVIFQYNSFRKC